MLEKAASVGYTDDIVVIPNSEEPPVTPLIDIIHRIPIFATLPESHVVKIAKSAHLTRHEAGQVIFTQGTEGHHLFIVLEGTVAVWKDYGDEAPDLLTVCGPGDIFGELALIDEVVRSATVVVREPCQLACIDKSDFTDIITEHPVGVAFMKSLSLMIRDRTELFAQMLKRRLQQIRRLEHDLKDANARWEKLTSDRRSLVTTARDRATRCLDALIHLETVRQETPTSETPAGPVSRISRGATRLIRHILDLAAASPDGTSVDMPAALHHVTESLFHDLDIHRTQTRVEIRADGVHLKMDDAAVTVLIVRDLLANALIHAFPDERPGLITVKLQREELAVLLTVTDNGTGFPVPKPIDARTPGLFLVETLAKSLGGVFTLNTATGTRANVRFPLSPVGTRPDPAPGPAADPSSEPPVVVA